MNKEVIELKQERSDTIAQMNDILVICKEEKRARTEEEDTSFDNADDKVRNLDEQIQEAERMETLNRSIKPVKEVKNMEENKNKETFDLARAIGGLMNNNLGEFDSAMQAEGIREFGASVKSNAIVIPDKHFRTNVLVSNHASDINTTVTGGLDVIAQPALYQKLGCTVWNGLKGNVVLNFSDGHDAAFAVESANIAESSPVRATDTMTAKRVGGQKIFSQEMIASSEVMASEFVDMIASIDRAISAQVIEQAAAASPFAANESGDTSEVLTYALATGIMAGMEDSNFPNPSYVMSKPLYHKSETLTTDSGSGRWIVERGNLNGYNVIGTTYLPLHDTDQYDVVFGDWSRAYIGFFGGGVELLVDPYSGATAGTVKIVFSRLADTSVNPAAFASYRNIKLA